MTIQEIVDAVESEPIVNLNRKFKRPRHGWRYGFWQNDLKEFDPVNKTYWPRLTIADLKADDWEFV